MNAPEFAGRCALVTGGAAGIGRATAATLAARGTRVAIADIDLEAARRTAAVIGGGSVAIGIDVRERASVQRAFDEALSALGGCDILIANAGVSSMHPALELTDEEWDRNFAVNSRGIFLSNQIAARHFVAQRRGVIVNTASLASKVGAPYLAHYSASKFAVVGWTQALARELASAGIRVNAVCPGFVKTDMQAREVIWESKLRGISTDEVVAGYVAQTPLGRLELPEDVADVIVFLCSNAARFMTGQALNVTGGVYMT
jgi:meso-butanediol dehydrogenase/(S,S)-butanediol dehydrogenase/diacetyl reductase